MTKGAYLFALLLLLAGCATPEKPFDTSKLQWPLAPDEARVKYVQWWSSEDDFGGGVSFAKLLLGESANFLISPHGVTTDRDGNLYVTDTSLRAIFIFEMKEKKVKFIGDIGEGRGFSFPTDVAVDNEGRIYVADRGRGNIFVFNRKGDPLLTIGQKGELKSPVGLVIDNVRKRLYVSNLKGHDIRVYDLSGNLLFSIGCGPERYSDEDGCLGGPQGLALDREGNLYVVDTFNFRVQSFTPEGKFRFKFGEIGDGFGNFAMPYGVAVDSDGNIYVSDVRFSNVQVFDKDRKYIFTIGQYGNIPGTFSSLYDIHVDEEDRIYVADKNNRSVQVFQYLSEKYKKEQAEQPVKK